MIRGCEEKNNCCGCTACMHICPVEAIEMKEDEERFFYPSVDQGKCIGCGKCVAVCPFLVDKKDQINIKQQYYAVKHKNNEIIEKSSSGGVFTAISDVILQRAGVIYGAAFTEGHVIRHERAETEAGRNRFRGSKYVQSDMGSVMDQVRNDLEANRWVLFSGTPCQVEGVKNYLSGKHINSNKLILCDFICHGVASPGVWKKYVNFLCKKYKNEMITYIFRGKEYGWHNPSPQIIVGNQDVSWEYKGKRSFLKMYVTCYITRNCCYNCKWTSYSRVSDITLGDFWNIGSIAPEMDDNKGCSSMIINTKKGEAIFRECELALKLIECGKEDVWQPHLEYANEIPKKRDSFWADFANKDFEEVLDIYGKGSLMGNCKKLLTPVIKKLGIYVWAGKLYKRFFVK